jgi:hypothetical protein
MRTNQRTRKRALWKCSKANDNSWRRIAPCSTKAFKQECAVVEGIEAQTKIENFSSIVHTVERGQVLPPNSARIDEGSAECGRSTGGVSINDDEKLKRDVSNLRHSRLKVRGRRFARRIGSFQKALEAIYMSSKATDKKKVTKKSHLQQAWTNCAWCTVHLACAQSIDEVEAVKSDMDDLRTQVRTTEDLSKTRQDVISCEETAEKELRDYPEGHTEEQVSGTDRVKGGRY